MKLGKKIAFFSLFIVLAIFLYRDYSINYSGFTDPDKIYYKNEVNVFLSDEKTLVNGIPVRSSTGSVYPSHDVEYYEDRDFYDSGRPYGLGTDEDKHTAEEAAQVTVVNITQPGTYRLHGSMSNGQIRVDLGKSSKTEETAVVNLVLDGVDINCDIAPAIIFKNAYECGSDDINIATRDVDTSAAGANIIIADGSINNLSGSRVAKVLKDMDEEKKLYKYDATITSNISLNINGEPQQSGVLNVNSDFEGITSSLHITVNGGTINIVSQDDGINTSEDFVSVTTINGGNLHILAGLRKDGGDGIDSNGWIVANGGTTVSIGHHRTDSGIDNDAGFYINGGTLISYGSYVDWAHVDSTQPSFNLMFNNGLTEKDSIIITDTDGNPVFCYDPSKDSITDSCSFERIGFVITSPEFESGKTYNLYVGYSDGNSDTVTGEQYCGFYDVSTITDIDAVQQVYHTNFDFGRGGFRPEEGKTYDIPNTEFILDRMTSKYALISDIY